MTKSVRWHFHSPRHQKVQVVIPTKVRCIQGQAIVHQRHYRPSINYINATFLADTRQNGRPLAMICTNLCGHFNYTIAIVSHAPDIH